ncbi:MULTISPECIES: Fur family transcriptional regulator [Cupriavidus]|uniref:Fur family transcriptional regulator n=1 Tax=Cupriavidus TaxID=106589 RepID=UPI00036720F5|nr:MULTISPECIES: transcriptional repressor [Cupriavidus]
MSTRTDRRFAPRPAAARPGAKDGTPEAVWGEPGRQAAQALAARGVAVSPGRVAVLLVLGEAPSRHVTADGLCRLMMASPYRMALSTFRAALYELTECGLLWRVSVPGGDHTLSHYYELADQPVHEHFFCTACGRFEEVFDATLLAMQEARLAARGLRPALVRSALVGRCAACVKQA